LNRRCSFCHASLIDQFKKWVDHYESQAFSVSEAL
jgi:hypothetical protein